MIRKKIDKFTADLKAKILQKIRGKMAILKNNLLIKC